MSHSKKEHGPAGLTERQIQALDLASRGCSNRVIGHKMNIGPTWAYQLLSRAYVKMGAVDRAHAVRRGFELGYLQADPVELQATTG